MPSTTPNRGYPYPLDTDQIDVAGDMQRLATKLDTDMNSEITGRVARDNQLISDYIARDNAIYTAFRADDVKYSYQVSALGMNRNDKLLIQGGQGVWITDGYGTVVIVLPVRYPSKYYVPIITMASDSPHFVHAMDINFRTPTEFRAVTRDLGSGGPTGAGHYLSIWWHTIGVNV